DGRFVAVSRDYDSAASRRDVEVWEVASGRQVLLLRDSPWGSISFHPKLPQIMIARSATAVVWNLETGQEFAHHPLEAKPVALKFAPDGDRFAALVPSGQRWKVTVHDAKDATVAAS